MRVRPAVAGDAPAMQGIYAPIVERTAISFEVDPPTVAELADRIETTTHQLPWLAAETADGVIGYAYASRHRARAAYRWSVDTTVYVAERCRGRGAGAALYRALLDEVCGLGYVSAYAGITLPNEASVALHESVGFVPIGRFPMTGFKLGRWHDVGWWHHLLGPPPGAPEEPRAWRP